MRWDFGVFVFRKLLQLIPHRVIVNCNRDPYLTRWFLFRTEPLAVFFHWFHRSDEDRALHDHPWTFITVILWRGYNEHTEALEECGHCDGMGWVRARRSDFANTSSFCPECHGECFIRVPVVKRRWPLTICYRPAEWRHRVELIDQKPAATLVFRFKKRREWGFWTKTGFVQWNKWWQENCE